MELAILLVKQCISTLFIRRNVREQAPRSTKLMRNKYILKLRHKSKYHAADPMELLLAVHLRINMNAYCSQPQKPSNTHS